MLVMRTDNHYDCVNDTMLDSLIKSKEIVKFRLNTRWVKVEEAQKRGIKPDKVFNGNNKLAINDSIFVRADRNSNK